MARKVSPSLTMAEQTPAIRLMVCPEIWHRDRGTPKMKISALKILATAAFSAIAATTAFAADMPVKARPVVVEVWTWDKFYIGLNGGYSWGRSDTSGAF